MHKSAVLAFVVLFGLASSEVLRSFPKNIDLTPCASHPLCHYKGYGNWQHAGKSSADQQHEIVIAVKLQEDAAESCDSLLMQISTPGSPTFGKFLTLEEVTQLTSDSQASRAVLRWLKNYDLSIDAGTTGDFITVRGTVAVLEELLQTKFHNFKHNNGVEVVRAASYAIPESIAENIDLISGVTDLPQERPMRIMAPATADGQVTPAFLKKFYNIDTSLKVENGASQSVFEVTQSYSPRDLKQFQKKFNLQQQDVTKVIGPNVPASCILAPNLCGEANLDVEYMMAIAENSNITFWSINPTSTDPFFDWVVAVSQDPQPPMVHSISYGSTAPEDPAQDVRRFNTEVCKMGLRGVSVFVASGDDGVASYVARSDSTKCGFIPSFPATSPYVTAVGATMGPESGKPEIACTSDQGGLITTGGGFSYWFDRPSYQDDVVQNYLKNGPNVPPVKLFNSTGRGYPDVAMAGAFYIIVNGGRDETIFGTSASSPVFAATITLINDMRIGQGKGPIGFLNPSLYSIAAESDQEVFNDITSGKNNCCAGKPGEAVCCQYGFTATTGWDPLTGLGSINFKNLADKLVNM